MDETAYSTWLDSDGYNSSEGSLQQQPQQQGILKRSSASGSLDSIPGLQNIHTRVQHVYDDNQSQDHSIFSPLGNNTLVFTARRRKNPAYIAIMIASFISIFLYTNAHATLHSAVTQMSLLTLERRSIRTQFKIVEHDLRKFQRTIVLLSQSRGEQTQEHAEDNSARDEMNRLHDAIKGINSAIESLQKHIQQDSRQDALEKYGSGVIRVELELSFPGNAHGPDSIVLEMASLNEMPHSVFMFLEMVDQKLLDGCSFILYAMGIIKAAPLPSDGSTTAAKIKAFTRVGLDSIAFREYSPKYPHQKNTVGFAMDGSPSFFINTNNNTEIHHGDPCFATIVTGFDTVKRLQNAPTRKDGMWYKKRIGLKRAIIL